MDTRLTKHQLRIKEWRDIILKRNESGLTVREFCKVHQLNEKRYFYWQRQIRMEEQSKMSLPDVTEAEANAVIFAPLQATASPESSSGGLTIHYGSVSLMVTESTPPSVLKKTLRALQELNGSW